MLLNEYFDLVRAHPEEAPSGMNLLPGVVDLVTANPAAAIFIADRDVTSTLVNGASLSITVARSLPGVRYAIFDADPEMDGNGAAIDVASSDWVGGDGGKITFGGLNPERNYAIRTLLTAPQHSLPMAMVQGSGKMLMHQSAYHLLGLDGTFDNPMDPTQQIHSAQVLPMMTDTDVYVVATGIDDQTGCGAAKIIPFPGNRYTVFDFENPQLPPLNAKQRMLWHVKLMGSDGKEIPVSGDDHWDIPEGLDWIEFILPAGGTYRFGGMTASGQAFVARNIVTLPSVGRNYFSEYLPSPDRTSMVRRIVIDPACPSSLYAAQWGKYAEPDWRRVKPGQTRLIIPVNPLITGRLSAAAMPIPLEEAEKM